MSATDLFDEIVATELGPPGVTLGRAFAAEGLMVGGKLYAFVASKDQLVVKLPAPRVQELAADGVGEPMSMGSRVLREWASIPFGPAAADRWPPLAREAREFVANLPVKPRRKRA